MVNFVKWNEFETTDWYDIATTLYNNMAAAVKKMILSKDRGCIVTKSSMAQANICERK